MPLPRLTPVEYIVELIESCMDDNNLSYTALKLFEAYLTLRSKKHNCGGWKLSTIVGVIAVIRV